MWAFQVPLYALLSHVMMETSSSPIQKLACSIIKDFLAKRTNWNLIKEIVLPLSVSLERVLSDSGYLSIGYRF